MSNLMQAHNQWANRPQDQRFETLAELSESVKNRRMRSRSVDVDLGTITAKEQAGTIVLNRGFQSVEPSHWSMGQLAGWIHAPAEYLRRIPTPLAIQCINHGIQSSAKERGALKFMAVTEPDKEVNTLQAVTSTTYGRIWDADCVSAVERIVERSNGRFYNPKAYQRYDSTNPAGASRTNVMTGGIKGSGLYASDRDVFMFMIDGGSLLDIGPRAQLNRGFFAWNSEVGARTFGLTTFLFNVVCGNHIVWGAQDVNNLTIRHTQNGPYRFDSEATPALMAYANATAKPIEDRVRKAAELIIGRTTDEVTEWLQAHGKFSRPEIKSAIDFAKAEEGDAQTLWQLVQGFTAYARGFDYVDARVDLETRAGKLLSVIE